MQPNPDKNKFSVTILGSGTCVPSLERSACSVMVHIADTCLVFDAGPGTMRRLLEAGSTIFDVSHMFLSHFHPDHTGELAPFLFANKYPDSHRRTRDLTLCGGPGFKHFFEQLKSAYKDWIDVSGRLRLVELVPGQTPPIEFEGFSITTAPVEHRPESIAFRITSATGLSMVYSGDTDVSENLIQLAQDTDLLICESALPDPMKVDGHLTPSLAGAIASRANVKKLLLTHFYPECDAPEYGPTEIRKQCRKHYSGPLVLAEDLLTIELDAR